MQREIPNDRAERAARCDRRVYRAGSLRGARAAVGVVVGYSAALGTGGVVGVVEASPRRHDCRQAGPASRAGTHGPAPRQRDRHGRWAVFLARGMT